MTAIAGMIRFDGAPLDAGVLERMQNTLAPYGRDAQHQWRQGSVGFVRTLLRTTPEDLLDQQPLAHRESDSHLVFDGRLDNREELCRELGISPNESRLLADSGLALQALLKWGEEAPPHFVGDFSLAWWQAREKRLMLARDPLGHRPLFWHQGKGFFAFATLPKGLFAIPGVPRAVCEERLSDHLTLIPMIGPESLFKDIYRVEPGQVLTLHEQRIRTHRYHRFDPDRELKLPSDDDYLEAFREKLDQAVASQLRSIGPIASHLSSGFDSSTITAVAARHLAGQGKRLTAYTSVPREAFDGPVPKGKHADEGPAAAALAARFDNIDHILIRTTGTSPLDHLQRNIEILDRIVLNPCNMVWAQAIQSDAIARGCRVMLTGQMGNMTISYSGQEYLPSLLGRGQLRRWWREAKALKHAHPKRRWRGLLFQSLGPYLPVWLHLMIERYRGQTWDLASYTAIHPGFMKRVGSQGRSQRTGWDLSYRPWADGRRMRIAVLNRLDNGEYQVASNYHGLDVRDPTSDLRLLEFCLATPDHQYLRGGQNRWLLRRLMGDVLPPEILNARTKGQQAADWYEAIGDSLPQFQSSLQALRDHGRVGKYLDLEALQADLEDWPQTGWAQPSVVHKFRLKLLRGLSAGLFVRHVEPDNS